MEFLGLGLVLRSVLWLGLVFWSGERVSNLVFVDKMMSISLAGENKWRQKKAFPWCNGTTKLVDSLLIAFSRGRGQIRTGNTIEAAFSTSYLISRVSLSGQKHREEFHWSHSGKPQLTTISGSFWNDFRWTRSWNEERCANYRMHFFDDLDGSERRKWKRHPDCSRTDNRYKMRHPPDNRKRFEQRAKRTCKQCNHDA